MAPISVQKRSLVAESAHAAGAPSVTIIRRGPAALQARPHSFLERFARSWTALLLLATCAALLVKQLITPSPATSSAAHRSAHTLRASLSKSGSPDTAAQPDASATSSDPPAGWDWDDGDLSRFGPDAHLSTDLMFLPSALVPARWVKPTKDLGPIELVRVMADPLLVTIERLLTPAECSELLELGQQIGFRRSLVQDGAKLVAHPTRTSTSAYVPRSHPAIERLAYRLAEVTGVPANHMEFGPVLRYEPASIDPSSGQITKGQELAAHWDANEDVTFGRRLAVLIPLAAHPEESGGATSFPLLDNYRFLPKAGAALIWRNYAPASSPDEREHDARALHAGEAPLRAAKYAINVWMYRHVYVHPQDRDPPFSILHQHSHRDATAKAHREGRPTP